MRVVLRFVGAFEDHLGCASDQLVAEDFLASAWMPGKATRRLMHGGTKVQLEHLPSEKQKRRPEHSRCGKAEAETAPELTRHPTSPPSHTPP